MSTTTLTPALTEAQRASLTKAVLRDAKPMILAADQLDPDWVAKFCTDGPDFRIVWFNGRTNTFQEAVQTWKVFTLRAASSKCDCLKEHVQLLDSETALYSWQGTMEVREKDGTVLRFNPFSETGLFRKVSETWKIASKTQSGVPTRP